MGTLLDQLIQRGKIPLILASVFFILYCTYITTYPSSILIPEDDVAAYEEALQTTFSDPISDGSPEYVALDADERIRLAKQARILQQVFGEKGLEPHPKEITVPALERLAECLENDTCRPGEEKVVLLASWHFGEAYKGHVSGEDIWATSTLKAFTQLNYTILYTATVGDTYLVNTHLGEMVHAILWEAEQLERCLQGHRGWAQGISARGCISTETHPEGIPIWKSFVFHFWEHNRSPIGRDWTLAPEDYGKMGLARGGPNQYLGYSIEERCRKIPFSGVREHRAILLGKRLSYFEVPSMAFPGLGSIVGLVPPEIIVTDEEFSVKNFTLDSTASVGAGEKFPEEGVHVIHELPQMGWTQEVAHSKVMIGVGWPYLSPSPYDALCLGVPFINPIRNWDHNDPENRMKWITQHDALRQFDPPYVYHVKSYDLEGLAMALTQAVQNPIENFIPPEMQWPAVVARHKRLMETDWHAKAIEVVARDHPDRFPFLL